MKEWQHGHELDFLLDLEGFYSRYNEYSFSPFSAMKKNTIASGLHNKTFKVYERADERLVMIDTKITKTRTPITMYNNTSVQLGVKEPGDRAITKLAWKEGKEKIATEMIESFTEPCWLFVWAEDDRANKIAVDAGFNWIGTKVTTFAELYAIYFKEAKNTLFDGPRRHPPRLSTEDCSIEKANLGSFDIQLIAESVSSLDTKYTNHYSNYNKGESWAALSLRGYSDDPAFITKPIEMSKKWQLEHIKEEFSIQDTALRKKLPEVENLLTLFPGRLHRVRLMSLSPGGGELERHTDQVDPDTGVQNGNVMRFHFPLVTNEDVSFTSWQVSGKKKTVHMKTGECWYLDTRKPHQAINNGDTNRIHLVVDVEVNEEVRELVRNVVSG